MHEADRRMLGRTIWELAAQHLSSVWLKLTVTKTKKKRCWIKQLLKRASKEIWKTHCSNARRIWLLKISSCFQDQMWKGSFGTLWSYTWMIKIKTKAGVISHRLTWLESGWGIWCFFASWEGHEPAGNACVATDQKTRSLFTWERGEIPWEWPKQHWIPLRLYLCPFSAFAVWFQELYWGLAFQTLEDQEPALEYSHTQLC